MILDALEPWLLPGNYLLTSGRHGNTSSLLIYLLQRHLKQKTPVTLLHHVGASQVNHFTALLAKCGVNVSDVRDRGLLTYRELDCPLDSPPDLLKVAESVEKVSENQVVVLSDIHLFLGLGCSLKDVVMLIQRLLRTDSVVIATSRDSLETRQLNTFLESMLGNNVSLDTLKSGASAEVDGHVSRRGRGEVVRALYKGSERGFKVFPLGTAPGTV